VVQPEAVADELGCFAFRELARELETWGDPGRRINLEGRLVTGIFLDGDGNPLRGCHVLMESAYFLDPLPHETVVSAASAGDDPAVPTRDRKAA
jgi:hypothetical protein